MRARLAPLAPLLLAPVLFAPLLLAAGCQHHRPELPAAAAVLAPEAPEELPQAYYLVTARGAVARSSVVAGGRARHYVLALTAFVLAWPDGRLLLIDTGSDEAATKQIGLSVSLFDAARGPFRHRTSLADALGARAKDARAVVFSHLHVDHTGGLTGLCAAREGAPLVVLAPEGQRDPELRSSSVGGGRAHVEEASCAQEVALADETVAPLAGFPGVYAVRAAGHTHGSTLVVAHVRRRDGRVARVAFAGDLVNAAEALVHNPTLPKPWYYRLAMGEDEARLKEARALLVALAEAGVHIAPAHDLLALQRLDDEGVLSGW